MSYDQLIAAANEANACFYQYDYQLRREAWLRARVKAFTPTT